MFNLKKGRILITGGHGFVGQHLNSALIKTGINKKQIKLIGSSDYDLRNFHAAKKATENIDLVFHLAANVGGVNHHRLYPGEVFYDNMLMGVNLIEASRINKVSKIVIIGTACSYPECAKLPFKEVDFWQGYPETNNASYAIAKKALQTMLVAYRQQYGLNGIYLIPVNMYGPNDNFHKQDNHVLPALISRAFFAKKNRLPTLTVWGSPYVTRDFLYVEDAVKGFILAAKKINHSDPINLTSGKEYSMKQVITLITKLVGYHGKVIWDNSKPKGQLRRRLSLTKAKKELSFVAKTSLPAGLRKTINWYLKSVKLS